MRKRWAWAVRPTPEALGRWIKVKPDKYVEPAERVEPGAFVSPYDIPEGIRVSYDRRVGQFEAEFSYMVDEKVRHLSGDGFGYRLGKHSGRIIGVETNCHPGNAYHAILEATEGVDTVTGSTARGRDNHRVVKSILEDYRDEIVRDMHALVGETIAPKRNMKVE